MIVFSEGSDYDETHGNELVLKIDIRGLSRIVCKVQTT